MSKKLNLWYSGGNFQMVLPADNLEMKRYRNASEIRVRPVAPEKIRRKTVFTSWLHLTLPTPTPVFGKVIKRSQAFLQGALSEGATIKCVHFHDGKNVGDRIIYREDGLSICERKLEKWFELPEGDCSRPLSMSVFLEFRPNSKAIFTKAGASFEGIDA